MENSHLSLISTTALPSLWAQETARQTTHKWVGTSTNAPNACIKCGLHLAAEINGLKVHALPFGVTL